MTCSALFFVSYPKYYPKIDGNDEKLFLASSHSNQQQQQGRCFASNRAWIVEKSPVNTDIQLEKDHKLVCVGNLSNLYKMYLPLFERLFILYKTS